jgi:hypothetical protein
MLNHGRVTSVSLSVKNTPAADMFTSLMYTCTSRSVSAVVCNTHMFEYRMIHPSMSRFKLTHLACVYMHLFQVPVGRIRMQIYSLCPKHAGKARTQIGSIGISVHMTRKQSVYTSSSNCSSAHSAHKTHTNMLGLMLVIEGDSSGVND